MCKEDSRDALINRLVYDYSDHLLRVCYVYLRDMAQAQDAVQDTFLKAIQSPKTYYSHEGSAEHQPLSYAVRDLSIVIADEDGKSIPDVLPYSTPIPEVLDVQVIDNNSGEILESRKLTRRGNEYV